MLRFIPSNTFSNAVFKLADYLQQHPLPHPFFKQWIIVQNKETEQWLNIQLAALNGIAANNTFMLPSELGWKVYRLLHPDLPGQLPSNRRAMQWSIYGILENYTHELKAHGLSIPDAEENRVLLAAQIADVFDLYQVYRPQMLLDWTKGKNAPDNATDKWQPPLWKELNKLWSEHFPGIPNRAEVYEHLKKQIFEDERNSLPGRILVVGLSSWSQPFFETLQTLSKATEVVFFPMQRGISDLPPRLVPVFDKWLKPAKDSISLLELHHQPKNNAALPSPKNVPFPIIKAHSCHNRKREVEVLKNELLNLLEQNTKLHVGDILVMVPDIEVYGHFIETEFQHHSDDLNLPVYIPDLVAKKNHLQALVEVLQYLTGQQKVSEFIAILEGELIRDKFGLQIDEVNLIQSWLAATQTHWGLTNGSRFSVLKAVQELYSGFAMETGDFELAGNLAPFRNISGSQPFDVLTKLSTIVALLSNIESEISEPRSIEDWLELFEKWTEQLMSMPLTGEHPITFLRQQIEYSISNSTVTITALLNWLHEISATQSASSSRIGNGIVVSSYIPYRNIPFKVVAILGLDESAFPRKPVRPLFDLIAKNPQPGERITKNDDALLFAERILETGQHLHISFSGEGREQRLPSILFQELAEAHSQKIKVIRHPLHAFNSPESSYEYPNYSKFQGQLARIHQTKAVSGKVSLEDQITIFDADEQVISLSDLISFYTDPPKYIGKTIFGITEIYEEELPVDRESFSLNGLQKYQLALLTKSGFDGGISANQIRNFFYSAGILPSGINGIDEFNEIAAKVDRQAQYLAQLTQAQVTQCDIDLDLGDLRLVGTIHDYYDNKLIHWRPAALKAVNFMELWIQHLALSMANSRHTQSMYLGVQGEKIKTRFFSSIDSPEDYLRRLIAPLQAPTTIRQLLTINPVCGYFYFEDLYDSSNPQKALQSAIKAWEGTAHNNQPGQKDKFYAQWFWKTESPVPQPDFAELNERVWAPILKHIEGEDHE